MGLKVRLYDLDQEMKCRLDNISETIDDSTKAIYIVHYFGVNNDLKDIRRFCDERNIVLIEDCALAGFHSDYHNSCGDISIYSLWKFHAVPDGAILKLNNSATFLAQPQGSPPSAAKTILRLMKIAVKKCIMRGIFPSAVLGFIRGHKQFHSELMISDIDIGSSLPISRISQTAFDIFNKEDLEAIASIRRRNFNALSEYCRASNIQTLFDQVGDKDIPYCFPVIVDDPEDVQARLAAVGVESEISVNTPPYPECVEGDGKNYYDLKHLSLHCISLPIHQNINEVMLDYIKEKLSECIKFQVEV